MPFQTINPTTNKVIKSFDEISDAALESLLVKATDTFGDWKKTDYKIRTALLHKVAGILRAKKNELAKLITLEMGKLVSSTQVYLKK